VVNEVELDDETKFDDTHRRMEERRRVHISSTIAGG
jgi:hypothetical protein